MDNRQTIPLTGILIQDADDKGFTAYFAEFPEVIAEGKNEEDAAGNLFEAFRIMLEVKKQEMGQDANFNENSRIKKFELAIDLRR